MKNKLTLLLSLALVLFIALGCSLGGLLGSDDSSTKETSKSADSRDSKETKESSETTEKEPSGEIIKVGIKECDELATYVNDNTEEIEGSYAARAIVYVYKNWIVSKVKENVEKMSEEEKAKMGEVCAKSFEQLKESLKK